MRAFEVEGRPIQYLGINKNGEASRVADTGSLLLETVMLQKDSPGLGRSSLTSEADLRAVALVRPQRDGWVKELREHGIFALPTPCDEAGCLATEAVAGFDVVVLDFDAMAPLQRAEILLQLRKMNVAVVALRESELPTALDCFDAGVDAIAPSTASAKDAAVVIWSAYRHAQARAGLRQRIGELELEAAQAALIERAKVVLARQSQISETEALRMLRCESRKQRRPMFELAKAVIAADEILSATTSPRPASNSA